MSSPTFQVLGHLWGLPRALSLLGMGRKCARQGSDPAVLGALHEGELAWGPGLSGAIFSDD